MSSFAKYILIALAVIAAGFILWYFSSIVAYIVVAAILSIVGSPLVDLLGRVRIGRFKIPAALRALITLLILWVLFVGFFRIFIPIVAREANELSGIDVDTFIGRLQEPIGKIESIAGHFQVTGENDQTLTGYLKERLIRVLDFSFVSNLFGTLASVLGNVFVAMFSISFITFFLLKDQNMITEAIVLLVPAKHEMNVRHAMRSVKRLLSRYFIGIGLQLTGILILVTVGMSIVGLGFKRSLLIGLLAAILNVVPYLGPLIGTALGILLGIAFNINLEFYELLPLAGYMLLVFLAVQAIDNILFQPLIFSSSVNAHPLEIFLVILIAGSLAGVTGMIFAIPGYTILRVFAKEFLNKFRVVKKLTEKI